MNRGGGGGGGLDRFDTVELGESGAATGAASKNIHEPINPNSSERIMITFERTRHPVGCLTGIDT